jgi:hypothetical protein
MTSHRFTEGRAWISSCPVLSCELPVIEAHVDGLKLRLDTKAVPLKDALILEKYDRLMVAVWKGPTQLWAVSWFGFQGRPDKGHIYTQHKHGRRK